MRVSLFSRVQIENFAFKSKISFYYVNVFLSVVFILLIFEYATKLYNNN